MLFFDFDVKTIVSASFKLLRSMSYEIMHQLVFFVAFVAILCCANAFQSWNQRMTARVASSQNNLRAITRNREGRHNARTSRPSAVQYEPRGPKTTVDFSCFGRLPDDDYFFANFGRPVELTKDGRSVMASGRMFVQFLKRNASEGTVDAEAKRLKGALLRCEDTCVIACTSQ